MSPEGRERSVGDPSHRLVASSTTTTGVQCERLYGNTIDQSSPDCLRFAGA